MIPFNKLPPPPHTKKNTPNIKRNTWIPMVFGPSEEKMWWINVMQGHLIENSPPIYIDQGRRILWPDSWNLPKMHEQLPTWKIHKDDIWRSSKHQLMLNVLKNGYQVLPSDPNLGVLFVTFEYWWKRDLHLGKQKVTSKKLVYRFPSLKLTAKASENRPPQKEISSSNHPYSGAMLVSGRVDFNLCASKCPSETNVNLMKNITMAQCNLVKGSSLTSCLRLSSLVMVW